MSKIEHWLLLEQQEQEIKQRLKETLKDTGLELNEFYVLYFLSQTPNQELRLNKLQEKIKLSQSAMSRLTQRLESKECRVIERTYCVQDKRGIYIRLTVNGQKLFSKNIMAINDVIDKYF